MKKSPLERNSGVALWRQIADSLRTELHQLADEAGRLPPEPKLAERFNVNRLTLRAAVTTLVEEGVLKRQQGRGTFVQKQNRLVYPISRHTRFSAGLENQTTEASVEVLSAAIEQGADWQADSLGLEANARLLRLETLATADKVPVMRTTSWFCAQRFEKLGDVVKQTNSITKGLAACGIRDYVRQSTRIEARHANHDDMTDLRLSAGGLILVTTSTNAETGGGVIQYSVSRMAAERIVLSVDYLQ